MAGMFHQRSLLSVPSICQLTELERVPLTLEVPPPPPEEMPAKPVVWPIIWVKSRPLLGRFWTTVVGRTVACTSLSVSRVRAAAVTSTVCEVEETPSLAASV